MLRVEASDPGGDELTQGDFVGRYSVLSRLGRGGMGVVYKAYDPQLDRNVALKLLRRDRESVEADLRLLREARTLAKLTHPNVVAVYDAGLTNRGVFIAMELLEGQTLDQWLDERPRRVGEIIAVFRDAGRGLAAAHDAGFVHRDFKPTNVHVSDDGSVRVLDFGLAYLVDDASPRPAAPRSKGPRRPRRRITERPSGRLIDSEIRTREVFSTAAGTVMGTPAFMAPEQLEGEGGDHRSEQFAFAMSLYVALYDGAPLCGETYAERRETIGRGVRLTERQLDTSASGERVPAAVRRAIVRGLATDPADRFESMDAMLSLLERTRRRRGGVAAVVALVLGFGGGAVVFDADAQEPCLEPGAALESAWGPEPRAAVRARFEAFERASTADSLRRVQRALDEYSAAWIDMYGQSCRATFVEHEQSERLFDQRMHCLERRRNRLRSAVDALVESEDAPTLIQRTIAAYTLPSVDACADVEQLGAGQPLPDDPFVRTRVARLRERLDEAGTRVEIGDVDAGIELSTSAVRDARELGYAPVLGEALASLGRGQVNGKRYADAAQTLREAILVTGRVGDDRTAATAWTDFVYTRMHDESADLATVELAARAAVERSGDPTFEGWLLNNLGVLHAQRGTLDDAIDYLRQALELKSQGLGERHVDVGISWHNLGNALIRSERLAEAEVAMTQALSIFEATVGAAHPMAHFAARSMCQVSLARGKPHAALPYCEAALADFRAPRASWTANARFYSAQAHWQTGARERAREAAARARIEAAEDDELVEKIERWLEDPDGYHELGLSAQEAAVRPTDSPAPSKG